MKKGDKVSHKFMGGSGVVLSVGTVVMAIVEWNDGSNCTVPVNNLVEIPKVEIPPETARAAFQTVHIEGIAEKRREPVPDEESKPIPITQGIMDDGTYFDETNDAFWRRLMDRAIEAANYAGKLWIHKWRISRGMLGGTEPPTDTHMDLCGFSWLHWTDNKKPPLCRGYSD